MWCIVSAGEITAFLVVKELNLIIIAKLKKVSNCNRARWLQTTTETGENSDNPGINRKLSYAGKMESKIYALYTPFPAFLYPDSH